MNHILVLSFVVSAVFADTPKVSDKFGKISAACNTKATSNAKHVWIFKQWHLSPSVDTKKNRITDLPQTKNQFAIYKQLEAWTEKNQIKTVLAEGCSGAIDGDFKLKFNGWDLNELKTQASAEKYADILTHIPLKLKAKFDSKLNVNCADSDELIKKENLAFSDARGMLGYFSRITMYEHNEKMVTPYLKDIISLLHLPKDTTPKDALPKLKIELSRLFKEVRSLNHLRNEEIAKTIQANGDNTLALVIGGLHAKDLISTLDKSNIACTVVEPVGYDRKAETLLDELEKTIR